MLPSYNAPRCTAEAKPSPASRTKGFQYTQFLYYTTNSDTSVFPLPCNFRNTTFFVYSYTNEKDKTIAVEITQGTYAMRRKKKKQVDKSPAPGSSEVNRATSRTPRAGPPPSPRLHQESAEREPTPAFPGQTPARHTVSLGAAQDGEGALVRPCASSRRTPQPRP